MPGVSGLSANGVISESAFIKTLSEKPYKRHPYAAYTDA